MIPGLRWLALVVVAEALLHKEASPWRWQRKPSSHKTKTNTIAPASATAMMVAQLRARDWAAGRSNDWVSACMLSTLADAGNKCACHGKAPEPNMVNVWSQQLSWQHPVEGVSFEMFEKPDVYQRGVSIDTSIKRLGDFDQVVFLGSGFDTRAYQTSSVLKRARVVFEMDLPASLDLKRSIVDSCELKPSNGADGVEYMHLDLTGHNPFDKLRNHSKFRPHGRTLFINEHVAEYLPEATNKQWMSKLSDFTAELQGESVFIVACWRWHDFIWNKNFKLNNNEKVVFGMPFTRAGSDDFMSKLGWSPKSGFDDMISAYENLPPYPYPRMLGIFKPKHS